MHNEQKIRAAMAAFKGIFKNNIHVRELSYPNTTKLYKFKVVIKQKCFVHAVSSTPHARNFAIGEIACTKNWRLKSPEFKKALCQ
jgi:hypothetical protein